MKLHVEKKRVMPKLVAVIVLVLLLAGFFFFTSPKNCGSNEDCFSARFVKCSKTKAQLVNNDGNKFEFLIKGKNENNCIVDAKLLSMSDSRPADLRTALEGKSMTCSLPRDISVPITKLNNINDYCTGQLKEASLQISLDKMYEILVQNIGPLASEFRDVLKGK